LGLLDSIIIKPRPSKLRIMRAKPEFRDRDDTQVAVLDALVERGREGMTVFELRSVAEVDIDDLEAALADLKEEGLIDVETEGRDRTVIKPDPRVIPDPEDEESEQSFIDRIREKLPF
jgi:DNA-binding transcriptional ArsR family regulator